MRQTCKTFHQLVRKYDLPSMQQMIMQHINLLNRRECKYMRTTDPQTLKIAAQILSHNQFLTQNILGIPNQSTEQTQSIVVRICDINKYGGLKDQYHAWKMMGKDRIVAVGGPSATDQTLISCMIPAIRNTHDIHYYCRDYLQSNILHSASQSHARHGNALNADPVLSGRHLLPLIFKRILFKTSLQSVLLSDYIKVDVKLTKSRYLIQYIKNQLNGIIQNFKSMVGRINQHDLNRLESVTSQQIQKVMESQLGFDIRSNNRVAEKGDSMAIHVVFTKDSLQQVKNQHVKFRNVKELQWDELSKYEIQKYFPHSEGILTAFRYHGDYSNKFDMYNLSKLKAIQLKAVWQENKTLSQVYVDADDNKNPYVCGISFSDGKFIPSNKVHLSLGFKAKFVFENSKIQPLTSFNVPATGVSMTILLKKTNQIKQIMQEKGKAMDFAIINSHWTLISDNQDYILMRATAGGNTGSEEYMPAYFLNLCANTRRIFGESFIGIVSSYGCSRAVNYKNSTQFNELAKGLLISYGKGGTGNTKRSSQAYKALKYLGLEKQLKQFFNSCEMDRVDIWKTMDSICRQSQKVDLYYNNYKATQIFLGF